ncbi:MAG: hypothetical protein HOQ30_08325 [Gemmatimonadaceae bacterium]|nr:hypothetical protein [Gemmatimonadaceae bacterium]NUR34002.1 hypothetical protein [Gemmatimonadaceae bacterium]
MRSSGARAVVEADTLVDSSDYSPRSAACLIDADSFRVAPRMDLLRTAPPDSGWIWHPFEAGDEQTYGIVRDSVQCEIRSRPAIVPSPGRDPERATVGRFHVFCYPE